MLTDNCDSQRERYADRIALDTSSIEGEILWRRLCALVRHTGGAKTLARNYRNKIVSEGLTESEEQEAWKMLDDEGY